MSNPNTNNDSRSSVQIGPGLLGLCTLATIVLAVLKWANIITITWLGVFLPLIIGGAVSLVLVVLAIIIIVLVALVVDR